MKIVEIIGRNFSWEGKMYGKGGTYELPDNVAKRFVSEGKVKIVKSLSEDEPATDFNPPNEIFLSEVRRHAKQIRDILNADYEVEVKEKEEKGKKKKSTVETEIDIPDENESNTENQNHDPESPGDQGQSEISDIINNTGSDENQTSEPDETLIPDKFPAKAILEKHGFNTLESIPRDRDELLKIDDIGDRLANQIGVRLSQIDEENDA